MLIKRDVVQMIDWLELEIQLIRASLKHEFTKDKLRTYDKLLRIMAMRYANAYLN